MEDDEILEVDSPLEHAVDADDDEIDELMLGPDGLAAAGGGEEKPSSGGALGSNRANVAADKPIHYRAKPLPRSDLLFYPRGLPYACETLEEFDARLEDICQHLVACVEGRDFEFSFLQWNHYLQCLLTLKYPVELTTLARIARLYYHIALQPGLHPLAAETAATMCMTLLGGRKITIAHLVLPWRPLYDVLKRALYVKERRVGLTNWVNTYMDLASYAQRFFDPDDGEAMLREILPSLDGSNINSIIATLGLLVHFLPTSHPQKWLPTLFKLWESFSSSLYDNQMLDLCARLAEQHVQDPRLSSEKSRQETGIFSDEPGGKQEKDQEGDAAAGTRVPGEPSSASTSEQGLWNDVGIFTESQFAFIMTKCLRSAGLPVGSSKAANAALMAQSSTVRSGADLAASSSVLSMRKPSELSQSYAIIIVYSMMNDSISPASTPSGSDTHADANGLGRQNGVRDESSGPHLAGSKALGALARYIQATESYFHPSNWGLWALPLSSLIKSLTWEFAKRWKEEERQDCKTPKAFRLTAHIKREFVSTLRTVCLLSLFSKDPVTIAASQSSMKRLALLGPDLILPSILERAYTSLEALETTHRTMSIITALSTLAIPLVSQDIYKEGGKHLVPLLHLCIPGIDLNDGMKTIATSILIVVASTMVKIDDLTRPELSSNAVDSQESKDDEEEAKRLSTAGFEDWAVSFFHRVLALFDALPEEGKGGRVGGRLEEQVTSTLLVACDAVCCAMSDHMFDITFNIVANHCLSSVSAQSVRVTGALVSCFARHNPSKVLPRLLKPCAQAIRLELEQGASSVRTTSTSKPLASDVALHWHLSILIGAMTLSGGSTILEYKEDLLDLMNLVCEKTKSERGYSYASTLVQRVLLLLVSIYPSDQRFVNPDEWESEELQRNSHKFWGKVYAVKDVKIQWHVPSDEEIQFALEIIETIVGPRLDVLEQLQKETNPRDKVWSNEFCRNLTVVRLAYSATNNLILEQERGGGKSLASFFVEGYESFKAVPKPFESGFLLKEESDPRYKTVKAFKQRFGHVLHLSAQKTQDTDAEDQIDSVKLLIRSIRTFLISYAFNSDDHKAYSRAIGFHRNMAQLYPRQKVFPRIFWIRRAAHHHSSRGRLNSFYRHRTELDDALISDVTELTMSNYTAIRKTAQNTLDSIIGHYEGARALILDRLLSTVRDSHDDDRIKGALYVLGSKNMYSLPLRNPQFTEEYIMTLLNAQHHNKPSLQKLLRGIINTMYIRFAEPCTRSDALDMHDLQKACDVLVPEKPNGTVMTSPARQRALVVSQIDGFWQTLNSRMLSYVQDPSTHWSFAIFGARFLRTLVRRDRPLRADVAAYFTKQLGSENPTMRRISQSALAKILLLVKVQTLCKTDLEIVLGKVDIANHPLKRSEAMPTVESIDAAWKMSRLKAYAEEPTQSTKLFDKDSPGWLVWADTQTYYKMPPQSGILFDWSNKDVLEAIEHELTSDHWEKMMGHFAQEKDRHSLSNETTVLIKSVFQIFGLSQLDNVRQHVMTYISERDRHRHRAAAEVIAGLFRGAKHWTLDDAQVLWTWLDSLFPKILAECTPDSQPAWQQGVEYMLQQRDPRRALSLINLIVKAGYDTFSASQSPWEQAKSHTMLRGVLLSLETKFSAWSPNLQALYAKHFETEFNEVRSLIASNVADINLLSVAPSYASVDTMIRDLSEKKSVSSIFAPPNLARNYDEQLAKIAHQLAELKKERVPKSQGTSRYDLLALTSLCWIAEMLRDHRRNAMALSVIDFIPTIFECCNLQDNAELSQRARSVLLAAVSTTSYDDRTYVERLIRKVLQVIDESQDSWRARLDALPVLQIVYFQNLFYLDAALVQTIIEALLALLSDPHLEVRNLASTTLSGIVRCSQRDMISDLRVRFTQQIIVHGERLPKRRGAPNFNEEMTHLHAGILGAIALIGAFPYSVPAWMPALICDSVARYQDVPDPVGTACKKLAAEFKRTHQDTWEEDKEQFDTEQLAEYYEWGGRTDYYA